MSTERKTEVRQHSASATKKSKRKRRRREGKEIGVLRNHELWLLVQTLTSIAARKIEWENRINASAAQQGQGREKFLRESNVK